MNRSSEPLNLITLSETRHPRVARNFAYGEVIAQVIGTVAVVIENGLTSVTQIVSWELNIAIVLAIVFVCVSTALRLSWRHRPKEFLRSHRATVLICLGWLLGVVVILLFGGFFPESTTRLSAFWTISQIAILARTVIGGISLIRTVASGRGVPALILVGSFLVLITIGTLLLMLPRARAPLADGTRPGRAPFDVALFTATSASCVTGLIVVPTGTYWSRFGQSVILGLFQIGGLGIMTWGAFFAVSSRRMGAREGETFRDLLDLEHPGHARRLVVAILGFTVAAEVVGAFLISGLWSDLPTGNQAFYSVFHATSAFCNAGFSLTENSFVGMDTRWQLWGVMAPLIIVGGLGFAVLYNGGLAIHSRFRRLHKEPLFNLSKTRIRLSINSRLVLIMTGLLLFIGTIGYLLLESTGAPSHESGAARLAEAWFQSVTFRTAGFNSVDHGLMQPATKLFAILLMFIGASPGSTGGGVKTVAFALTILSLFSVIRGRDRVEIFNRTISGELIQRALLVIAIGIMVTMSCALLLVLFEKRPELFLDHLFEATSAFGTVGVSSSIEIENGMRVSVTESLSQASRLVIIVTMFLGRVGPLTLLLAVAPRAGAARYDFPHEKVSLG